MTEYSCAVTDELWVSPFLYLNIQLTFDYFNTSSYIELMGGDSEVKRIIGAFYP